jgi:hypothetical protein
MDARLHPPRPIPGQLQLPIGAAVRAARRGPVKASEGGLSAETGSAVGCPICRHCGAPAAQGWRLCAEHVRALLDELGEPSQMYARAA